MSLPIPTGSFSIDDAHSHLGFTVAHLGIAKVRGSFTQYSGTLNMGADLASTAVTIEAEMASVHTGNSMRDGHLLSDGFFDSENHPKMTFVSTGIAPKGEQYVMNGDLTIRGVTKPVALDVAFNGTNTFPMDGSTRFGFEATGKINRSDFGVSFGIPMASDEVNLSLEVQFVQPAAPAA
jgi:polyisoprenoid-binding protein YceI